MIHTNKPALCGPPKQSTGCRGGPARKQTGFRNRAPKRGTVQASSLEVLSMGRANFGTLNIRGGLEGNSGKIEALVLNADRLRLGVLALQEVNVIGIIERVVYDFWGRGWSLHVAGPSTAPRRHGTGSLVHPDFEVVNFTAISPRVSWIKVRCRSRPMAGEGIAHFVAAYAPTESNSS